MNWKTLQNPLEHHTETALTIVGGSVLFVGSLIAWGGGVTYDGVLDMHLTNHIAWYHPVMENLIIIGLLSLTLWWAGKLINKRTRWIDIFCTVLLFRIPYSAMALLGFVPINEERLRMLSETRAINSLAPIDWLGLGVIAFFTIVLVVYAIMLLYNGFKTATNARGAKHTLLFIAALIVAEIVSIILFHQL